MFDSLKIRAYPLLVTLVLLMPSADLAGQVSSQIARTDSAAVLLRAGADFEARGRSDVAEALYRFVIERFPDSPAAERARERLQVAREEGTAGEGSVELEVWSTLYGLWLGVAIPGAFGADSPEPYGAGLLVGGPAGFLAGRAISRSRELTEGQARAITLGGTWGSWQGFGWVKVLDIGTGLVCPDPIGGGGLSCYDSGDDTEEVFAGMIVGGLTGMATGALISRRTISPGTATSANFGALWGTWFGFAAAYMADAEDDGLLAASLIGGDAGLFSAALLAPRWDVSRSRARLVSLYGVVGGLAGLGLDLLFQPDGDKVVVGVPLAGSVVGLGVGVYHTRDYDRSRIGLPSGSGGEGAFSDALVRVEGGGWSVGAPLPYPVTVERIGPEGPRRTAALGVTLLRARF